MTEHPSRPGRLFPWLAALAVFLLVLCARHGWIIDYGSSMGFWDQWEAEAVKLIKPFIEGTLSAQDLLAPHNEHRIVLHRLLTLLSFSANGEQWDNAVSAIAMAVVWSGFLAIMTFALCRQLASAWMLPVLVCLLAINLLPYAWESVSISLQTVFLQTIALTVITLYATTRHRLGMANVAAAVAASVLSIGTVASSLITPAAGIAALALRWWTTRSDLRNSLAASILLASVALAGAAAVHVVPGHATLKAQTSGEFIHALGVALSWPIGRSWLLVPCLWLPWLALSLRLLMRRGVTCDHWANTDRLFAMLGVYVWMLAAAVAYSRGHGMDELGSRYAESIAIGLVVNAYAMWRWVAADRHGEFKQIAKAMIAVLMTSAALFSLNDASKRAKPYVEARAGQYRIQQNHVSMYVNTGNHAALRNQPHMTIPFPNAEYLIRALDDPSVRSLLPASVRLRTSICDVIGDAAHSPHMLLHFTPDNCRAGTSALSHLGVMADIALPNCDDALFIHRGLRTSGRLAQFNGTDALELTQQCRALPAAASIQVTTLGPLSAWLGTWRAPGIIPGPI